MLRFFRNKSLRHQLTIIILTLVMIPPAIMFFANRTYIQSRLYKQTSETYATALTQTGSYLSDRIMLARNLVNMLFADSSVQQGVDFSGSSDASDGSIWLADISSGRAIYKGSLLNTLSRVYFYQSRGSLSFQDDKLYASLDADSRSHLDAWYADDGQTYYFLTLSESQLGYKPQYVYLLAKVPSATRLNQSVGLIQAAISTASLEDILSSAPVGGIASLYLVSADGSAFIQSGEDRFNGESLIQFDALLESAEADPSGALIQVRYEGALYLGGSVDIEGTDWRLIMAIPMAALTSITRGADRVLMVTFLLLLGVIMPVTALLARRFLRLVYSLQDGVNAVSQGDYSQNIPSCGIPEFDRVIDSFNHMCQQTQVMMDAQYRMGRDLKNRELQVLQEQINPHFLYNTIDLLHWQARKAGNREMEDIIYALSQFYRLSLGHGEEIVTIGHELQHVSAYMRIQNIRFMNRIQLRLDVPEDLKNVRIVKMVLQPLVENSIQHGIREKPDETGTIEIRARREVECLLLSVSDDGVGMDQATIDRIITSEHPGYGVYNVNDRLVLHYGSGAGLVFHSEPGCGTTVSMRIPL